MIRPFGAVYAQQPTHDFFESHILPAAARGHVCFRSRVMDITRHGAMRSSPHHVALAGVSALAYQVPADHTVASSDFANALVQASHGCAVRMWPTTLIGNTPFPPAEPIPCHSSFPSIQKKIETDDTHGHSQAVLTGIGDIPAQGVEIE